MVVGDLQPRPNRQLFVVAARNEVIRAAAEGAQAVGLELGVIDVAETSQRNLQTALTQAAGLADRATAALVRHGPHALLTICAGGELYYARRIDWEAPPTAQPAPDIQPHGAELRSRMPTSSTTGRRRRQPGRTRRRSTAAGDRTAALVRPLGTVVARPAAGCAVVQVGDDSSPGPDAGRHAGAAGGRARPGRGPARLRAGGPTPAVREAVLPIVGALLRQESRRL
jgi:hypothetical protein